MNIDTERGELSRNVEFGGLSTESFLLGQIRLVFGYFSIIANDKRIKRYETVSIGFLVHI